MAVDRGSVTAEFAAALPAVVLLLTIALGALSVGAQSVRLQDAAGMAARGLARGEPPETVSGMAGAVVPGAALARADRPGMVCVRLTAPGPLMLPGLSLRADSCALAER